MEEDIIVKISTLLDLDENNVLKSLRLIFTDLGVCPEKKGRSILHIKILYSVRSSRSVLISVCLSLESHLKLSSILIFLAPF